MKKILADFCWILASLSPYCIFFILTFDGVLDLGVETDLFIMKIPTRLAIVLIVFLLAFLTTSISLRYFRGIPTTDTMDVQNIKPAEPVYIPMYIGYFIITIGINSFSVFACLTFLLVLFIYKTKVFYFNPIAYIFKLNFYEVTSKKGISFFVISSKKNLKQVDTFRNLIRLNNFSFIEKEEE